MNLNSYIKKVKFDYNELECKNILTRRTNIKGISIAIVTKMFICNYSDNFSNKIRTVLFKSSSKQISEIDKYFLPNLFSRKL